MAKGAESVDVARHVGIKYDQDFDLSDGDTWMLRIDSRGRLVLSPSHTQYHSTGTTQRLTATLNGDVKQGPDVDCGGVLIKAPKTNSGTVYIGFSNGVTPSNGYDLTPGETVSIPVQNMSAIYVYFVTSGDSIALMGTHD